MDEDLTLRGVALSMAIDTYASTPQGGIHFHPWDIPDLASRYFFYLKGVNDEKGD